LKERQDPSTCECANVRRQNVDMMDITSIYTILSALAVAAGLQFFYRFYQHRKRFRDLVCVTPNPPLQTN
jgi:hypothetical protein